jgi:hypothetical protein
MGKIRIFEHTSLDGVISPDKRNEGDDFANGGWPAPRRPRDPSAGLKSTKYSTPPFSRPSTVCVPLFPLPQ